MGFRRCGWTVGIIIALTAFALITTLEEHERASAQQHDPPTQRDRSPATLDDLVQPPPRNPYPRRNEWREEQDLVAQQEMADWAFGVLWLNGIGVFVTLVGVIFVARTLHHTRVANDINKRAFEEAERPLFFADVLNIPRYPDEEPMFELDDEPRTVVQNVQLHNVGTRPAFGVSLRTVAGFLEANDQRMKMTTEGMAEFAPGDKKNAFTLIMSEAPHGTIEERMAAGQVLHISGIFTYDDTLGIRRQRGYRFIAKRETGLIAHVGPRLTWERVTDPRYNYDRRIESDRI